MMNKKNVFADIRDPGVFGKNPIIGLLMFVVGALIFTTMALNLVSQGPLIKLDTAVANGLHGVALKTPPWVIKILIEAYYVGKQGIAVGAYIFFTYFLFKKRLRESMMVIVTFAPLGILFLRLSQLFIRPRPFTTFQTPIWAHSPNIPGFPSGHSLSILVLSGFAAYFLVPKFNLLRGKIWVISTAAFIVIFMSFSRLFIGDHYLTDIIAGYGAGIAWFALSCTFVEFIFEKFEHSYEKLRLLG